ncbi:MAG: hypothetical protein H7062_14110, partial [Candidatus Saccharimonas sp.]|nr:hypothetical protein [Planctomycetaceae bacterium]
MFQLCRFAVVGLSALTVVLFANVQPVFSQTDEQVEVARLKAIDYIRKQQQTDGRWEYTGHDTGITALCTLALIENGTAIYDPVVEKGYRYVKKHGPERKETYDIALSILLLARVGDRQDRPLIRALGAKLLAGQLVTGGWTYTCPDVDASILQDLKKIKRKEGAGCNSNTQFGVLGLWVASRYGVPVDDAMKEVGSRFVNWQGEDGGWPYTKEEGKTAVSGPSMTCAGLFCLAVARASKIRTQQRDNKTPIRTGEKDALLSDPIFAKGLSRVTAFAGTMNPGSARYFVWTVERVGVLLGIEKFDDKVDWFKQGADALIKSQKEDGSWPSDKPENSLADACFASLFLRKANLGSDISRLLQGQPDKAFVVINRPDAARGDSLQDLLKLAQPGDVIRVEGNGPFKLSHDVLDKDLTIQAGFGYDPVFEFQMGFSPEGLRYRAEKDKESHTMLRVTAGTVTLEGLRLQMDPPVTTAAIPWKCIQVTGGTLRMLNCAVSEGNRRGTTVLTLSGEGQTVIRNCFFAGGRAAIEIVANGKQDVTFDNTLLYSNTCVSVINDPQTKQPADLDLHAYQTIFQGTEAFGCPNLAGELRIDSIQSAYKCDAIGLSLLTTASNNKDRTWKGANNCYNVTSWIGSGGKKNLQVTDVKSFNKFWGDTDKEGSKLTLSYASPRKNGGFSHAMNPQDWDIS